MLAGTVCDKVVLIFLHAGNNLVIYVNYVADIDECEEHISGCNHNCTNTIGSYNCSCYDGFKFSNDSIVFCEGMQNSSTLSQV